MLDNKNSFNYDNRNLSDVFKELQELRNNPQAQQAYVKQSKKSKRNKPKAEKVRKSSNTFSFNFHRENRTSSVKSNDLTLSHILTGCGILVISMALFFPKDLAFSESYASTSTASYDVEAYELNRHRLNMQSIISENAGMDRVKEQATEEREVEFETTYTDNPALPKGEEIVTQEGALGKDQVTVVKTYENGNFVEETILARTNLVPPTPKLISRGTSEFLAKHNIHIGDTIYLVKEDKLKSEASDTSTDVADIKASIDVKLLELPSEDWAKVSFDGIEGYIKTSNLTSPTTTPNIVEKNRIQRILLKVNIGMELNKTSGLTLNDYKKIFTNIPNDRNKVFENNYQVFYNAEKKYNINGIFLASIAIHESAWGSSNIANDKNNLFGYGAYDESPYESSQEFDSYADGIETVAKSLVKYYLNPAGTKIYDGETAEGWYYNGPTVEGVNTRYASDENWHNKVYNYMEMLYKRLDA